MREYPCQQRECLYCREFETDNIARIFMIDGKIDRNSPSPCPICSEFVGFSLFKMKTVPFQAPIIDFSTQKIIIPDEEPVKEPEPEEKKEEVPEKKGKTRRTKKRKKRTVKKLTETKNEEGQKEFPENEDTEPDDDSL